MDELKTERVYYFPMKILPWSNLSAGGAPLQRSQTEEAVGFIPVYGHWEEVHRFFGPGVQVGTFTAIRDDLAEAAERCGYCEACKRPLFCGDDFVSVNDCDLCRKCYLEQIAENNSEDPVLANFEQGVRDGLRAADPKAVTESQEWSGPQTMEEARWFHQGVLSGLTIYAREKGDSTLKGKNELLKRLVDEHRPC